MICFFVAKPVRFTLAY